MTSDYFSDREIGSRPRVEERITPVVWDGFVGILESLINKGAFGADFPELCQEGEAIVGTSRRTFSLALRSEIPTLEWPLRTTQENERSWFDFQSSESSVPSTLPALDLVEFCHRHVALPVQGKAHPYYSHYHLTFDREVGQREFRARVNRIFARNGLAYELRDSGRIERLAPPVLRELLASAIFNTGDSTLDDLLEQARRKFLSHNPETRRESIETLWDGWERLKTLGNQKKPQGMAALLQKASVESAFRDLLDREALELTKVGNTFQIRHKETGKVAISESAHVDYLFHRMFALIFLLVE